MLALHINKDVYWTRQRTNERTTNIFKTKNKKLLLCPYLGYFKHWISTGKLMRLCVVLLEDVIWFLIQSLLCIPLINSFTVEYSGKASASSTKGPGFNPVMREFCLLAFPTQRARVLVISPWSRHRAWLI